MRTDTINRDVGSIVNFNQIKKNGSYLEEPKYVQSPNDASNGIKTVVSVKGLTSENVFRPGIFKNKNGLDTEKSQTDTLMVKKLLFVTQPVKGATGSKEKKLPVRSTMQSHSGKLAGLVIANGEEVYKKNNT
jgi:hypothetical protein